MKASSIFILLGLFVFSSMSLPAQDITFYADVMVTASAEQHRNYAAQKFDALLQSELEKSGSWKNEFEQLEWISIQYPEDRSFRTLTWQIEKAQGGFQYGGYLQKSDGTFYKFTRDGGNANTSLDRPINWSQWRGGLVYKIISVPQDRQLEYYLLSFYQADQFTKVKVLEPITITDTQITLGSRALFATEDAGPKKRRLVLKYSADTQASINYDPSSERIILDHLTTMAGRIPGQGPAKVPDGSYVAYQLEADGTWSFIDKLYNQKFIAPPSGGISSEGKDLFGRGKN